MVMVAIYDIYIFVKILGGQTYIDQPKILYEPPPV